MSSGDLAQVLMLVKQAFSPIPLTVLWMEAKACVCQADAVLPLSPS